MSGGLIDVDHLEALLQAAARAGEAVTYAEALGALGFSFSRPKMRALCKALEDVDARARGRGEPELAVLVVRQSDRLPGQGWWVGTRPRADGYAGAWEGPEAARYVRQVQGAAFTYWKAR
jgi:hypothetical protein